MHCARPLAATSIVACQQCLAARESLLAVRALHLRYPQTPLAANAGLFHMLKELLALREAGSVNETELHCESQGLTIACAMVRACPVEVSCAADLHALLPDVAAKGSDVALFVDQIVGSGCCDRLRELRADAVLNAKMVFKRIPWVGMVGARELADAGFRTVPEVHAAFKRGDLAVPLHEMAASLFSMAEDCRFMDAVSEAELAAVTAAVTAAVAQVDPALLIVPVGGARRGAPGHDIDLLITHPGRESGVSRATLVQILEALSAQPEVERLVGKPMHGEEQSSRELLRKDVAHNVTENGCALPGSANISQSIKAFCLILLRGHTPRRLDIALAPRSQYAMELFGWTGSRQFGRWMRLAAKEKGLMLSNHGLTEVREVPGGGRAHWLRTRTGAVLISDDEAMAAFEEDTEAHFRSEEELFDAIGIPFRPPSERFA